MPEGAKLYASNEACRNQAFIYNDHVLAVQFHPEIDQQNLRILAQAVGSVNGKGPFIQQANDFLNQTAYFDKTKEVMFTILSNFVKKHQSLMLHSL